MRESLRLPRWPAPGRVTLRDCRLYAAVGQTLRFLCTWSDKRQKPGLTYHDTLQEPNKDRKICQTSVVPEREAA